MPQVQILEGNPGFGSMLGQSLGSGLGQGLSASLQGWLGKRENIRKSAGLAPVFEQFGIPKDDVQKMINSGLSPQELIPIAGLVQKQRAAEAKMQAAQQEDIQSKQVAQDSFNRMSELLKSGNLGVGSKLDAAVFGGKKAEAVGEFESLTGALEALLVDKVSRGTLSNARFKYITETLLPKVNDRDSIIKGKLKALATELNLDSSVLLGKGKAEASERGSRPSLEDIFK